MQSKPAKKSLLTRALITGRNLRAAALFKALRSYCAGSVLDIGGSDFYTHAANLGVKYDHWTVVEPDTQRLFQLDANNDPRVTTIVGDGCDLKQQLDDAQFDTVLLIHVLEHVMQPQDMLNEAARLLRPGGHLIAFIPQTASTHLAPNVFYNFSRYWIEKATQQSGLTTILLQSVGGLWTSIASQQFFFFFHAVRTPGYSDTSLRRSPWFYLLAPVMALYTIITLPILMLFGLGDLSEQANNHLLVAQKPR